MNDSSRSRNVFLVAVILLTATTFGLFGGCRGDYSGAGSGTDFLDTGRTSSNFTAIQVDPQSEDSAGPQFVVAEDLNGDGLMDLVSAWNQSQPVQVHLQGRTSQGGMRFETVPLAGGTPTVTVAGLEIADFDADGQPDIAVLIKESLVEGAGCLDSEQPGEGLRGMIQLYLGPDEPADATQALAWEEVRVEASFLQGVGESTLGPEFGGFTGMDVGDMDRDGDPDIVVAWNSGCGGGVRDAVVFTNHGPGAVRDGSWTGVRVPDAFPKGAAIKDVATADIDRDGDLDIIATFPTAPTMNVRWYRNPTPDPDGDPVDGATSWQVGLVSHIAPGADVIAAANITPGDDFVDVLVRSSNGQAIQWLRGPEVATTSPARAIPWQVYTLAEFSGRAPTALAVGDLNFDGQPDVIASATGTVAWFDADDAPSVFDQWGAQVIIDDLVAGASIGATDPGRDADQAAGATFINSIIVVDLDGDGANDLVATLDRPGINNDAIAWLRNDRRVP